MKPSKSRASRDDSASHRNHNLSKENFASRRLERDLGVWEALEKKKLSGPSERGLCEKFAQRLDRRHQVTCEGESERTQPWSPEAGRDVTSRLQREARNAGKPRD